MYAQNEIEFLRLEIKGGTIKMQSHVLEKINKFPDKITNRKQLERFLGCLTYASDFIKDLAKIRKPLQKKLKKDESWTWNSANSTLEGFLKEKCKDLPTLTLPNENDELVLETDESNNHCSAILKIKENNQ